MNFIYNYNNPNYDGIIKKSNKINNDYLKEKKNLANDYENILLNFDYFRYQELMLRKKKLDVKYILKIIAIFKPILKSNVVIFLHGSYSRNMNRWHSDIDLNILYKNKYKSEYIVVEEFVNALIYQMLDFKGRDRIHNIMLYYPLCENKKYEITGNKHIIICPNNTFNFCCRDNYNSIYPLILNSSRDPKDLYRWILGEKHNDENQYSFQGLNFKGRIFVSNLTHNKSLQHTIGSLKKLICQTCDDIKNVTKLEKYMLISDLNKNIKIHNFHIINNFLLCLKEYICLKKGRCYSLDFYKIIHHKIIKKEISIEELNELERLLTKYRFIIDRLENLFMELNINFSSREDSKIDMGIVNELYKKKYGNTFINDYQLIFNACNIMVKILQRINVNNFK